MHLIAVHMQHLATFYNVQSVVKHIQKVLFFAIHGWCWFTLKHH